MSVNKVILVGRLGRDPELRFTPSGQAVANFSIATDAAWKDRDGNKQTHTEWHRIVVWGPQAEPCQKFLTKGREVFVEGEIRSRKYQDKTGVERTAYDIVARDVRFLGSKDGGGRRDDSGMADEPAGNFSGQAGDDDIPF